MSNSRLHSWIATKKQYHDRLSKIFRKFYLGIWLLILLFATFDSKEDNAASLKVNAFEEDVRRLYRARGKRSQSEDVACQAQADENFKDFDKNFQPTSEEIEKETTELMEDYVSV